ncbi:MAG TPA: helix-turn-helix domain-containing protein, partial [Myxococcota bacterium]
TSLPPMRADASWYEVLDVAWDADRAAIFSAYKRALALVDGDTVGGYFALDPDSRARVRADIETAFAVLGDAARRARYDQSLGLTTTPPTVSANSSTAPTSTLRFLAPVDDVPERVGVRRGGITFAPPSTDKHDAAALVVAAAAATIDDAPPSSGLPTAVPAHVPRPIGLTDAPTPTPTPPPGLLSLDGEVNGQTIRRLREARRLDVDQLAELTKIRRPYLVAIEEHDIENLPSRVYLRGFLTQIARVLRVDKTRLADGYIAFIARFAR